MRLSCLALCPFFLLSAVEPAPSLANLKMAAEYNARTSGVSLLVMHEGTLLFEDYPRRWHADAGPDRAWGCASGTKGFNGPTAALMVADGLIDPLRQYADPYEEPACVTLTEWADPTLFPNQNYRRITIRHLLSLTSGLDANYTGSPPSPSPTTYAKSINAPVLADAGTMWQYGANPFQIWGEIARRKLKAHLAQSGITNPFPCPIRDYLQPRIFAPIGAAYESWKGTPRPDGGVDFWLAQGSTWSPREWAPWGELLRRGGTWQSAQLIPQEWLDLCFIGTSIRESYGISWWLDRGANAITGEMVSVLGAGGQDLFISRQLGLVVIRQTGSTSKDPSWESARVCFDNKDFFDWIRFGKLSSSDRDGDMIPDVRDQRPDDPREWQDADEDARPEVIARDGLGDNFEQFIIDADPADTIIRVQDVDPEGDSDGDGVSNLQEFQTQRRSVVLEVIDGLEWSCTSEQRAAVRSGSTNSFAYLAAQQDQIFVMVPVTISN